MRSSRSRFEAANQGYSIHFGDTPLLMLEHLNGFHSARNFDLIWFTEDGKIRPAVEKLLNAIEDVESHGRTQTVNLRQPVPVHIQYWTAWVNDDNLPQFRKDIYQRDEPIRQALREPQSS